MSSWRYYSGAAVGGAIEVTGCLLVSLNKEMVDRLPTGHVNDHQRCRELLVIPIATSKLMTAAGSACHRRALASLGDRG